VKEKTKQKQKKDEEENKMGIWDVPLSNKPQRC
jgi:hypothetical protein